MLSLRVREPACTLVWLSLRTTDENLAGELPSFGRRCRASGLDAHPRPASVGSRRSPWRSGHAAARVLPAQASGARRSPPGMGADSLHWSSARPGAPSSSASASPSAKASVGTNTSAHLVVPARRGTVKRPATLRALQRRPVVEGCEVDQRADIHPLRLDRARDLPPPSYRFGVRANDPRPSPKTPASAWMQSSASTLARRPLRTIRRSTGGTLLLLGKGAVFAHRFERPLAGGSAGGASARTAWPTERQFPPAATSNRACGSLAHGSPTSFTAGIRSAPLDPPVPEGTGGYDESIEADQS